jgi:hypothetical protein
MEPSLTVVHLVRISAELVADDMIARPTKSGDGIWRWDRILDAAFKDHQKADLAFWSAVYCEANNWLKCRETWDPSGYGVVKAYADRMKWDLARRALRDGGVDVSLLGE